MNKIFEDMDKDLTAFLDAVLPLSKRQPKVFEKKSAITKEKKLLVFILNVQTSGHRFNLDEYSDDVIGYGITKDCRSLRSMLDALYHKGYVSKCGAYGNLKFVLTKLGEDEAEFWFKKLEDEAEMTATPSTSQKQKIDSRDEEIENLKRELLSLYKQNVKLKSKVDRILRNVTSHLVDMQNFIKDEARITR